VKLLENLAALARESDAGVANANLQRLAAASNQAAPSARVYLMAVGDEVLQQRAT
jgi:hypothetical protein